MLSPGAKQARGVRKPKKARDLVFLSAWWGLAAGLIEVGTRVLCRAIDPSQRLYLMSRHFIWLGPLSNLVFFLGMGLVLAMAIMVMPRMTPLHGNLPTLAEYVGGNGYATAGFVANLVYCSQDTGLARGFTHYEDYDLEKLAPLRTAGLVEKTTTSIYELITVFDIVPLHPLRNFVHRWFVYDHRKDAASISRAFLNWLTDRRQPDRPFFAFLNLLDAHQPYVLPRGAPHRFMTYYATSDEYQAVYERWQVIDKTRLPQSLLTLARDSYDDCLHYIDEHLGLLFDELERRGVLDRTLIIVTADHGEGLGEHSLFDHGESLYRTEILVPLVIVPPSGLNPSVVVDETVSLRDLPATIVDLVGQGKGSPFPGESLRRFWRESSSTGALSRADHSPVISELTAPNPVNPNQGRSPASRGPLISLAEGSFVYIRNDGDGSEQLFNERDDPREIDDRAQLQSMRPVLEKLRSRLDMFRKNSATPRR